MKFYGFNLNIYIILKLLSSINIHVILNHLIRTFYDNNYTVVVGVLVNLDLRQNWCPIFSFNWVTEYSFLNPIKGI